MYQRRRKWTSALDPSTHSESGWENTFTIEEEDAVDVRFRLSGYGWKQNAGVENQVVLEKGSYKIYYRENGASDWIFLARVEADRAGTDETNVYKKVGMATGVLSPGKYDIKIVADRASIFTAWGGALEGITSGGKFWSDLQVRVQRFKISEGGDDLTVTEDVGIQLV